MHTVCDACMLPTLIKVLNDMFVVGACFKYCLVNKIHSP